MARRPTPPPPTPVPLTEPAPSLSYELTPISLLQRSPTTRDEVALRDEVRKQFAAVENAVVNFAAAKRAEGFDLDEAFSLSSLELPLFFAFQRDGSRIRAWHGFRIIERSE
ncbi:hypothetical protein C3Y89_24310 [Rhizobium sp. UPM1132]|uniref:hypothetical protein n=1 Tax=Rhizobium ruizarguesonis TaxID=2081791 RepID=UPI001444BAC6|nr:hypothetical protein [Rhizobium ruizarguesonis]NKQ73429.1 hypothetical protein [Rhizobium ruizarguesonis]